MMNLVEWVVLVYKIPSEPTKYRASVWREIKRLGGLYLQSGVCIFPDIDDVLLNVTSLGELVRRYGGSEYTFVTKSIASYQSDALIAAFHEARDEEYATLIEECSTLKAACEADPPSDLGNLQDQYKKLKKSASIIRARDYFAAPLGVQLTQALQTLRTIITNASRGDGLP